jgi:hypothetical protein
MGIRRRETKEEEKRNGYMEKKEWVAIFFSFNCRHGCWDFKKEGLRVFVHVFRGGISRVKMSLSEI